MLEEIIARLSNPCQNDNFFNDATSPEIQTQLSSMIKCTPENSQFQNCSWLVAPAKSFGESGLGHGCAER